MQNVSTFLNIETIFITLSVNPTLKRRFLIQKKVGHLNVGIVEK